MARTVTSGKYYPATRPKGMATRFPKIPKADTLTLPPKGSAVKASSVAECIREMRELDAGDPIYELMGDDDGDD